MKACLFRTALSAALMCTIALAQAQSQERAAIQAPPGAVPTPGVPAAGRPPGGAAGGPPPAAVAACVGKAVGAAAELTTPRGDQIQGHCQEDGRGRLVLRPDLPPGAAPRRPPPALAPSGASAAPPAAPPGLAEGGYRGPPPEAFAACAGKQVGGRAQLTTPGGKTLSGTCAQFGDRLVLRPDRPPAN